MKKRNILLIILTLGLNAKIMATEIKTSIIINASPEKVWKVFTNFYEYPLWNPFINPISGEIKKGEKLRVQIDGTKFKPKILEVEENKKLEWKGRLILPKVFDGQHLFELVNNDDGTTTFIQSEKFTGVLVPIFKKKILTDVKENFEKMNTALKKQVERV